MGTNVRKRSIDEWVTNSQEVGCAVSDGEIAVERSLSVTFQKSVGFKHVGDNDLQE